MEKNRVICLFSTTDREALTPLHMEFNAHVHDLHNLYLHMIVWINFDPRQDV